MRKIILLVASGLILAGFSAYPAWAGEIDILVEKLVEKGVISHGEARQILTETQEEMKAQLAQGKSEALPAWVQAIKLKGDFRLRGQEKHQKSANNYNKDTTIGRVRLRLGLEGKVNEKLLAGVGIASGSGDPRSTNVTLGDSNLKKALVLDYAYAKYSPLSWFNLVGGKMLLADALWMPTDLVWDSDITPEGVISQFNKELGSNTQGFLNAGVLLVDDDSSSDYDAPMAYIIQPGISHKINDNLSLKGAVSLQAFHNLKGHVSSGYSAESNTGNTDNGTTPYTYDYQMINPALEVKVIQPFNALGLNVESLKLLAEYVNNFDVSEKASGFSAGFKLGHEKISKWGDWQLKYIYAMLGKDAVLDVLPDSDRYGGATAIRSYETELSFGLGKNTSLGIDVYRSEKIGMAKAPETLVQVDWNVKF